MFRQEFSSWEVLFLYKTVRNPKFVSNNVAVRLNENKIQWYGVRIFYNRVAQFTAILDDLSIQYFVPMHTLEKQVGGKTVSVRVPLVNSLAFVQTTEEQLKRLQVRFAGRIAPYTDPLDRKLSVIPEKQMDQFIRICELQDSGLQYLGDDAPKYHQGERVRVTQGIFKGFEGYIKRIRHDRKLIVTVKGVAAFATGFIPPACLEKIAGEAP